MAQAGPDPLIPILTVAIPTWNRREKAVRQSIAVATAIAAHARPGEVELLVGDNASDDGTGAAVRTALDGIGAAGSVITHPVNLGLVGNLVVLARCARGRHLWLVGDDDHLGECCMERVLGLLRSESPGLLFINHRAVGLDGSVEMAGALPERADPTALDILDHSGTSLMFITACVYRRADLIQAIDGDALPSRRLSAPLWWSLATASSGGLICIREVLVDNEWGDTSWSAQRWKVFMLQAPRDILGAVRIGYPFWRTVLSFLRYWRWRLSRVAARLRRSRHG